MDPGYHFFWPTSNGFFRGMLECVVVMTLGGTPIYNIIIPIYNIIIIILYIYIYI